MFLTSGIRSTASRTALYHEELMGTQGFTGDKSLRTTCADRPQSNVSIRAAQVAIPFAEEGPIRHQLLRTLQFPSTGDAVSGRVPLLANSDLCISIARPDQPMPCWYRYAHGDEVIFVHEGTGLFESQFGNIHYGPGDYLVIPTGIIWRIVPDNAEQRLLVVESAGGHVRPPKRYLNEHGQFLESAPYSERDIRPPEDLVTHDEEGEFEVRVKARNYIGRYIYRHHPLDVVGWDGHLWPFAFNIADFEPITGRVHQPPPVHQTFDGPGFVLCSFVPRLFDYHPQSIPAPYNHSNVDSDEVIYYVKGDFMSRKGVEPGAFTVHPNGIPHGPHPGGYEGSIGKTRTDELAVMVDTFRRKLTTTPRLRGRTLPSPGDGGRAARRSISAQTSRRSKRSRRRSWVTRRVRMLHDGFRRRSRRQLRFTVQFSVFESVPAARSTGSSTPTRCRPAVERLR
jgi:homogentisate 1,2-dioxygenase